MIVNFRTFVTDENIDWNSLFDYVSSLLVKHCGIFDYIKSFITLRITKQLYFADINPCIDYGSEVYRHICG